MAVQRATGDGRWVTMRGRRVFIAKGQSPGAALQESLHHSDGGSPAYRTAAALEHVHPEKPLSQPVHSWEEVKAHAEKTKPMFDALIADQVGGKLAAKAHTKYDDAVPDLEREGAVVILAPLKGEKRAMEKVQQKYGGDAGRLTDVVRGTIAVDTEADVVRAVSELKTNAAKSGFKIVELDNKFAKPTEAGYRDVALKLMGPNGHVAELQINTKAMLKAKDEGHKLYEQQRSLYAKAAIEKRNLTSDETATVERLNGQMKKLYEDAAARGRGTRYN